MCNTVRLRNGLYGFDLLLMRSGVHLSAYFLAELPPREERFVATTISGISHTPLPAEVPTTVGTQAGEGEAEG
ncbi:MAG: hypothetical protein ABSF91_15255 [Bacteroidota bacterium]|jgi:hypothetical protein